MPELNDDQTLHLLHIAASDLPRPLDDLCARLRAVDGVIWMNRELEQITALEGTMPSSISHGAVDLQTLKQLKKRGKQLTDSVLHARDRLAGLLVHDLAVAAALVHFGTLLSSRPRDQWDERWIAMSCSVPEPWRTLLRRAADSE